MNSVARNCKSMAGFYWFKWIKYISDWGPKHVRLSNLMEIHVFQMNILLFAWHFYDSLEMFLVENAHDENLME